MTTPEAYIYYDFYIHFVVNFQARKSLAHMKEMDLLDFLAYLPLFLLVHSNIVDNPLNLERNV